MKKKSSVFVTPFSCDIGGSLGKVAFLEKKFFSHSEDGFDPSKLPPEFRYDEKEALELNRDGEKIQFIEFETIHLPIILKFLKENNLMSKSDGTNYTLFGTGGGVHRFKQDIESELSIKLDSRDEMKCLVDGISLVLENPGNIFKGASVFSFVEGKKKYVEPGKVNMGEIYPFMFVNIGSGISIILVEGPNKFKRITGSCLGGGTFLGLVKLLIGDISFDKIMEMAIDGDHRNVDLLVGDIYGKMKGRLHGLDSSIVASSFGKVATRKVNRGKDYEDSDMVNSLIYMIGINIAHIVTLTMKVYGVKNLFFSGGFMRRNQSVWGCLIDAVKYYERVFDLDKIAIRFIKHHKYLGCLGCLLKENGYSCCDGDGKEEEEEEEGESDKSET